MSWWVYFGILSWVGETGFSSFISSGVRSADGHAITAERWFCTIQSCKITDALMLLLYKGMAQNQASTLGCRRKEAMRHVKEPHHALSAYTCLLLASAKLPHVLTECYRTQQQLSGFQLVPPLFNAV